MPRKAGSNSAKEVKEAKFDIRDVVLGKIRGFPPWPGMVVDPETVPKNVKGERPQAAKKTFYCVRFFPKGDYSWLPPAQISPLPATAIDTFITTHPPTAPSSTSATKKGGGGELLEGYKIARDPGPWEVERDKAAVAYLEEAGDDEEEEEEEDELDGEGEDVGKKRKRASTGGSAKAKKEKKEPAAKKEKKEKVDKRPVKKQKKSKEHVESEDGDGDADAEGDDEPVDKRAKRESGVGAGKGEVEDAEQARVREWRNKLQKTFLPSKDAPKKELGAKDISDADQLFKDVESYEKMTIAYLTTSKIGKVMRHIAALESSKVPLDDKYHFRSRAKGLVDKWQAILHAGGAGSGSAGGAGSTGGIKANGSERPSLPQTETQEVVQGIKDNLTLNGNEGPKGDEDVVMA